LDRLPGLESGDFDFLSLPLAILDESGDLAGCVSFKSLLVLSRDSVLESGFSLGVSTCGDWTPESA